MRRLQICIGLAAAAAIGAGILLDQPAMVWAKAVTICLECVGLG
jgi:hypothetical protein